MTLTDTHCHVHFDAFDADRAETLERARRAGVRYLVLVGTHPDTNRAAQSLAAQGPDLFWTAGLHPHHAHEVREADWTELRRAVSAPGCVAVGEIGLDYFKSQADPAVQREVFERMLDLALEAGRPVVVHSRDAFSDTAAVLESRVSRGLRGLWHCYSYGITELGRALATGFYVSFAGNVTYKSASRILEAACEAPLDRLLLETDSPYLAPQAFRGQRNEPSHVAAVASFLAERRGLPPEALAEATTANARRLFGWEAA